MSPQLPSNPYIAGAALSDKHGFFGREEVLHNVERILKRPQAHAVFLYGQPYIGKSSVLLQLSKQLPNPPFTPVYFDLLDKASLPINQVLYQLAVLIAAKVNIAPPQQTDFEDNLETFHHSFLPTVYQVLGDEHRLVFLLDEFDILDETAKQNLPRQAAIHTFYPYLHQLTVAKRRPVFVLATGRHMAGLSIDFLAAFKAERMYLISTLSPQATQALISQAGHEDVLRYDEAAIEYIKAITHNHPYLIQLICRYLFDRAQQVITQSADKADTPSPLMVTAKGIEKSLPEIVKGKKDNLQRFWDGLPLEDRLVLSAIASQEQPLATFSEANIITILEEAGLGPLLKTFTLSPQILADWEMLEQEEGQYRFHIELLRRWAAEYHPLDKVKAQLDDLLPTANTLYQTAYEVYEQQHTGQAITQLSQALELEPEHLQAHLLLGAILQETGQLTIAINHFETAYQLDQETVHPKLIAALLDQGDALATIGDETKALAIYKRVLTLAPDEQTAQAHQTALWEKQADRALSAGDFDTAIDTYRRIGATDKLIQAETQKLKPQLEQLAQEVKACEVEEKWALAAECYQQLIELDPYDPRWPLALEQAKKEQWLPDRYAKGASYIQQQKWDLAIEVLSDIVSRRPTYEDAAELLALAKHHGENPFAQDQDTPVPAAKPRYGLILALFVILLVIIGSGLWVYSQTQIQAQVNSLVASTIDAQAVTQKPEAEHQAATAQAQATAAEIDVITRIAAAVNQEETKAAQVPSTDIPTSTPQIIKITPTPEPAPTFTPLPTTAPATSPNDFIPPTAQAATIARGVGIYLQDDFSSNTRGWPEGLQLHTHARDVTEILDGKYRRTIFSTQETLFKDPLNLTAKDFVISIETTMVEFAGQTGVGLAFREDQNGNYYLVRFMNNSLYDVGINRAGSWQPLQDPTFSSAFNLTPNVTNSLAVAMKNSTLTVYANGQSLTTLTDSTLNQAGKLALIIQIAEVNASLTVDFDNLLVTEAQ